MISKIFNEEVNSCFVILCVSDQYQIFIIASTIVGICLFFMRKDLYASDKISD